MAGVLEELFNMRTNGNGYVLSEWDDILIKRDLERLVAEGRVREMPFPISKQPLWTDSPERKRFRDIEAGEAYEYVNGWERGRPRFNKVNSGPSDEKAPTIS
jgi:hypothetical protein